MPYTFLEDASTADVAFEAYGKTLSELFESAGMALADTMVEDAGKLKRTTTKVIGIDAPDIELLLFNFLQELIFYKDAELLLFGGFRFDALESSGGEWRLHAEAYGEEIDPEKHDLIVDVKAVALYHFSVEETAEGWRATVILDV